MRASQLMKILEEEHVKLGEELKQKLESGMTNEQIVIQDPFFAGRMHQINMITLKIVAETDF